MISRRSDRDSLDIHAESAGNAINGTIVLVPGLGMQLTSWPDSFCESLIAKGYRVVRIDNRDAGLSDGMESAGTPDLGAVAAARRAGEMPLVPYTLDDMANDVAGMIERLHLGKVHVVGMSMGGMIAQLLALNHKEHVASLVSIMSTTGNPNLPGATPEAQKMLTMRRTPPTVDRDKYLDEAVESSALLGGTRWTESADALRREATLALERAYRPTGFLRQYAAIMAAPDRRERLKTLSIPTTVIHGTDDPLVRIEAGRDTAACIPDCELVEIEGMGHSIPPQLEEQIAAAIVRTAVRAR